MAMGSMRMTAYCVGKGQKTMLSLKEIVCVQYATQRQLKNPN